jgi:hypothetical protein|tara:strand:- start:756 stop:998 length:243 start_codon:yes stop_codon:yes gene_type:complete
MSNELREEHAKRLLDDQLFVEAFDTLEKNLLDTWTHSSVNDVDSREQCWLSLRLLERIRLHLTSIIETGNMARKIQEYQI